ncbi:MAG: leucine-rich repeat domain-containing protein [Bacteroides sp.]|nr:leucine-rich repeat domain-containing protein [Bacteroides sp.]
MKFKKFIAGALAFALAAVSLPQLGGPTGEIMAEDYAEDFDYTVNGDTVTITGYKGSGGDVVIPETIEGKTVTHIGATYYDYLFGENADKIISITIPSSIKYIYAYESFSNCSSLTRIEVDPDNPVYWSEDGVLYKTFKTWDNASQSYKRWDYLITYPAGKTDASFIIPDIVTYVYGNAFDNCRWLTAVNVHENVEDLGIVPDFGIFDDCYSLEEINVDPNNSKYTSEGGVLYNKDKTDLIRYPAMKESEGFLIPDTVTCIFAYAFSYSQITSVKLAGSIEDIRNYAFFYCTDLKKIEIGENITDDVLKSKHSYNEYERLFQCFDRIFLGCNAVEEITVDENNPYYSSIDGVVYNKEQTYIEYCPPAYGDVLTVADNVGGVAIYSGSALSLTEFEVGEGNAELSAKDGVLYTKDQTMLLAYPKNRPGDFTIPEGVTDLSGTAFNESLVEAVTLPNSITGFNGDFQNCAHLTSINIPETMTKIGLFEFIGCFELSHITLPSSITKIYNAAFSYSGLTSIVIPSSATFISEDAFYCCPCKGWDVENNGEYLTIYGESGSYAEEYAAENNIHFEAIKILGTDGDGDADVEIITEPEAVPDGTAVSVTEKERTDVSVTYDITLTVGGVEIHLNGTAQVKLPVPEGWNAEDCRVYRKEENGGYTDMLAKAAGGFLSFFTDHFSEYVITTEDLSEKSDETTADTSEVPEEPLPASPSHGGFTAPDVVSDIASDTASETAEAPAEAVSAQTAQSENTSVSENEYTEAEPIPVSDSVSSAEAPVSYETCLYESGGVSADEDKNVNTASYPALGVVSAAIITAAAVFIAKKRR